MPVYVGKFIEEQHDKIRHMYGYTEFLTEFNKRRTRVELDILAKKLLSNDYGNACQDQLCHAFRKYAFANTDFMGGTP